MSDTPATGSGERSSLLTASGAEARRQAGVRSNERVYDVYDGVNTLRSGNSTRTTFTRSWTA